MDDKNSNDINNLKDAIVDNTIDNNQSHLANNISNPISKKKSLNIYGNKLASKQAKITCCYIFLKFIVVVIEEMRAG